MKISKDIRAKLILGALFAIKTFSINAFATTLPASPVARDDVFELTGLTLNVTAPGILANDSGTDVIVSSFFNPSSGTLNRIVTDGSFLFTPERGFSTTTSFNYLITDTYNRSSTATVTIDGSKNLPKANDDYYTLNATTLDILAPGLLSNDRGGIGDVIVSSFLNPSSGTLNRIVTDGSFKYTPARGFAGVDTFTYNTLDELGRGSTATVHIDAGASIPVAFDDFYEVKSGSILDISAPGLLGNDRGGIGDVIVSSFFNPTFGSIKRIVTDGSFQYIATSGFVGTTYFDYGITDELGRNSVGRVMINVSAVPEPSTYAMMFAGLFIIGFQTRRKKIHANANVKKLVI